MILGDMPPFFSFALQRKRMTRNMAPQGSALRLLRSVHREPQFSRKYLPSDPVNLIDWRAFARTDQLLVREKRENSGIPIHIHLSMGETMGFPSGDMSKGAVGSRIAFNLGFNHMNVGDTVRLTVHEGRECYSWAPRTLKDWQELGSDFVEQSVNFRDAPFTQLPELPASYFSWCISDGLSEDDPVHKVDGSFAVLHLLSDKERDISWVEDQVSYIEGDVGPVEYRGIELQKDGWYDDELKQWLGNFRKQIRLRGGVCLDLSESLPVASYEQLVCEAYAFS